MSTNTILVNDRVKRVFGGGPLGVVFEVREEVTANPNDAKEKRSLIIGVRWDNGTKSHFSPDGLDVYNG